MPAALGGDWSSVGLLVSPAPVGVPPSSLSPVGSAVELSPSLSLDGDEPVFGLSSAEDEVVVVFSGPGPGFDLVGSSSAEDEVAVVFPGPEPGFDLPGSSEEKVTVL